MRRLALGLFVATALGASVLVAQDARPAVKSKKPAISSEPWPEDEVLLARRSEAENRRLFAAGPPLEFTLASSFGQINKERTPNNGRQFPGTLTVDGADIPVQIGSRGHLRLKSTTCDFVPLKVDFSRPGVSGTVFDGQTSLKLGTHCRTERDFDQYVIREYLAYRLANVATSFSFRARFARATYVDAASNKKLSTHAALFLEHERDVARRLGGREVNVPHLIFKDFDQDALTATMLLEYMLGNTDYSIYTLHNIVIVQDKRRKLFPVAYDFDLSGMVNTPYAAPDERLHLKSVTDRLYRGPCRTVDEFEAIAAPFRAGEAEMMNIIESSSELNGVHKREMKDYLESFFRRIGTRDAIKRTFVDGCPASRGRV